VTNVRRTALCLALAAAVACSWVVSAAPSIDVAVLTALKRADPSQVFARVWIVSLGETLYLSTDCGIVLLAPDGPSGYLLDVTTDGRVRVVPGLP